MEMMTHFGDPLVFGHHLPRDETRLDSCLAAEAIKGFAISGVQPGRMLLEDRQIDIERIEKRLGPFFRGREFDRDIVVLPQFRIGTHGRRSRGHVDAGDAA